MEDALASLLTQGNIAQDQEGRCTVTPAGREIADSLDATLPLSVRDKALEAAFTLLAQAKAQRENRVDLTKTKRGYQITCHISDGEMDLMAHFPLCAGQGSGQDGPGAVLQGPGGRVQAGAGLSHRRHRPCPGIPAEHE